MTMPLLSAIPLAAITFDNLDPVWFWALVALAAIGVLGFTYRSIFQRSGKNLTWALFQPAAAGRHRPAGRPGQTGLDARPRAGG